MVEILRPVTAVRGGDGRQQEGEEEVPGDRESPP
jgi:hypothetical protein